MFDLYAAPVALRDAILELAGYDDVVLATGVTQRIPAILGVDHPMVMTRR